MDQIWNKFYDSVIASINNSSEKYLSIQEAIGVELSCVTILMLIFQGEITSEVS